jgi:hypothetical protein
MSIPLERLTDAVKDIKWGTYKGMEGSHSASEYKGMCKGFDMLVKHFQEKENEDA